VNKKDWLTSVPKRKKRKKRTKQKNNGFILLVPNEENRG